MLVAVAHAAGGDLDQHLTGLRRIELDLLDAPRRVDAPTGSAAFVFTVTPSVLACAADHSGTRSRNIRERTLVAIDVSIDGAAKPTRRRRRVADDVQHLHGTRHRDVEQAGAARPMPSKISCGLTTTTPSNSRPLTASA